jgi:hypothetical protein
MTQSDWIKDLTLEGVEPNPGPLGWSELLEALEKALGSDIFNRKYKEILEKAKSEYDLENSEELLAHIDKIPIKPATINIIKRLHEGSEGTFAFFFLDPTVY